MFSNNNLLLILKISICALHHQTTYYAVFKTQTLTTRQAKSRRDDPISPRYAMSGFHIGWHDMAAEFQ
jgi:hypothetical protein